MLRHAPFSLPVVKEHPLAGIGPGLRARDSILAHQPDEGIVLEPGWAIVDMGWIAAAVMGAARSIRKTSAIE